MTSIPRIHVLLVEDYDAAARLSMSLLERSASDSYDIRLAHTLAEAIDAMVPLDVDVVLLDLNLPDSSGLETLLRFREHAPVVPVVVLSAAVDEDMALQCIRAGASEVLNKGVLSSAALLRALRFALLRGRVLDGQRLRTGLDYCLCRISTDGWLQPLDEASAEVYDRCFAGMPPEQARLTTLLGDEDARRVLELLHGMTEGNRREQMVLRAAQAAPFRSLLLTVARSGEDLHALIQPLMEELDALLDAQQTDYQYRSLIERSQDGVFIVVDGMFVFANTALEDILGFTHGTLTGMSYSSVVAPEDIPRVVENYQKRLAGDEVASEYVIRLMHREGYRIPVNLSAGRVEFRGNPAVMGTVKDISAQQRSMHYLMIQRRIAQEVQVVVDHEDLHTVVLNGLLRYEGIDIAALFEDHGQGVEVANWRGVSSALFGEDTGGRYADFWPIVASVDDMHVVAEDECRFVKEYAALCAEGVRSFALLRIPSKAEHKHWVLVASLTTARIDASLAQALGTTVSMVGGAFSRVETQEALRESEELYKALVEKSHDAIFIRVGQRIAFANERMEHLIGYTREELCTMNPFTLLHPGDRERVLAIAQARDNDPDTPTLYEARVVNRAGEMIFGEFASTVIRYQGSPATLTTVRDATERRKNEAQLRHSEELIQAAGFAASRFLRSGDWNAVILEVLEHFSAAAATDRVGLMRAEDEGSALVMVAQWPAAGMERATSHPFALRLEQKESTDPWWHRLCTGSLVIGGCTGQWMVEDETDALPPSEACVYIPVFEGDRWWGCLLFDTRDSGRSWLKAELDAMHVCGETLGAAIQRKAAEVQLLDSKERAERGDRIRQAFIANMSHEVRTPLNIILGYSSLLQDAVEESQREECEEFYSAIDSASNRLIRTVDSVLTMSRYQAGDIRPILMPVTLNKNLVDGMAKIRSDAELKGLHLALRNECETAVLLADPQLLNEILSHLLDNAVKFTREGSIEIHVSREDDELLVDVSDTGVGIAQENLDRIFEPYIQEDMGFTRAFEGVGLGLTLVRTFMDIQGGRITVASEKGKGTTFRLHFPPHMQLG